jgi:TPR repeat protein
MADWQFLILVALLLWLLWRTRAAAETSRWLRDALLRRMFEQLNILEAQRRGIPVAEVQKESEQWWEDERAREAGRPKGWPFPWAARPTCGPWCHSDWHTRGVRRVDQIGSDVRHEEERAAKSRFDLTKKLAEEEPGNALLQERLGVIYAYGWGATKDEREAVRLFRKAAEMGQPDACHDLAAIYFNAANYLNGNDVQLSHKEAYFWEKFSVCY